MEELAAIEVYVDDPHTWVLHHLRLAGVREAARRFDPDGRSTRVIRYDRASSSGTLGAG